MSSQKTYSSSVVPSVLHPRVPMPLVRAPMPSSQVQVRSVWASNLKNELALIFSIIPIYMIASIDTEFPGAIHRSDQSYSNLSPQERYSLVKKNTDELNLIQLGITLCDGEGNLPDLGSNGAMFYVWEFNFRDFDIKKDPYAEDSIVMLKNHGIDFMQMRMFGIDSRDFVTEFFSSGIRSVTEGLTWVTFAGSYDLSYLLKILDGGKALPVTLEAFMARVEMVFGKKVFDVKHLASLCEFSMNHGIYGKLDHVAGAVGIKRAVGQAHNVGSDSLLACNTFLEIIRLYLGTNVESYAGKIYGFV